MTHAPTAFQPSLAASFPDVSRAEVAAALRRGPSPELQVLVGLLDGLPGDLRPLRELAARRVCRDLLAVELFVVEPAGPACRALLAAGAGAWQLLGHEVLEAGSLARARDAVRRSYPAVARHLVAAACRELFELSRAAVHDRPVVALVDERSSRVDLRALLAHHDHVMTRHGAVLVTGDRLLGDDAVVLGDADGDADEVLQVLALLVDDLPPARLHRTAIDCLLVARGVAGR